MNGIIRTIKMDRGFGFIQPDGGTKDIFFHFTALVEMHLAESLLYKRVSFDVEETDKGSRAVNVRAV